MRISKLTSPLLLASLLALSGCTPSSDTGYPGPASEPTPTPDSAPHTDPTGYPGGAPLAQAATANPEPPPPDATASPTASPTPAVTAGPSPTPRPSPTPGPTPEGLPETDPESWVTGHMSPDGRWWVRSVVGEPLGVGEGNVTEWYHRGLQVVSRDQEVVRTVIDEWSRYGIGFPSPAVRGWSPDSRWVYLYERGTAGGCDVFGWTTDLLRLDPETGEQQLLHDGLMSGGPALSADGQTLAFADRYRIVFLRPDEGSYLERWIPGAQQGFVHAGELRFEEDGRLALTIEADACSERWTRVESIADPVSGEVELLGTPAPVAFP